jgi:hypothetical protein
MVKSRISATFCNWHGSCSSWRIRGFPRSGRGKMDKFEALAFAVGFIATGFLTFVASMPIV